jgi:hypothetical protein
MQQHKSSALKSKTESDSVYATTVIIPVIHDIQVFVHKWLFSAFRSLVIYAMCLLTKNTSVS